MTEEKKLIDFMGMRMMAVVVSVALIGVSLYMWFTSGPAKFGVDFVGGTELVVQFQKPIKPGVIRKALKDGDLRNAMVQSFEQGTNDFSIRVKGKSEGGASAISDKIKAALNKIDGNSFVPLKQDYVGPVIGEKIREDGLKALGFALLSILIYLSVRFEWRFALGAISALVHDVVITSGVFILSGREISAAVLAALLTIIGYSLNDTIIVFDRVRENLSSHQGDSRKKRKETGRSWLYYLVNTSINQTLSRTVLTSITTLFVVTTLWLLGGGAVADLAFALVIGVVVGTYSSVFVACTTVLALAEGGKSELKV